MKLEISSFADAGNPQKERLVIRALSELEVGEYLVLCTSLTSEGKASAGLNTAYWFPDKKVRSGDLVVLYSKTGKNSEKKLESGVTAHFFYWGLDGAVWSHDNGAVLMLATEWNLGKPQRA